MTCKGENNTSPSASSPSKSRHKNNINTNDEQPLESLPTQSMNKSIVTPPSVASTMHMGRSNECEIQNQDRENTTASTFSTTLPLVLDETANTEQPKDNNVPSECSTSPNNISENYDKRRSRTRSPTPDNS